MLHGLPALVVMDVTNLALPDLILACSGRREVPIKIMTSAEHLQRAREITGRASREPRIRVVLADAHPIVRYGLREVLALETDFEVVGEASNAQEVAQVLDETRPDILIVDVRMIDLSKLQSLRKAGIKVEVVILASSEDRNAAFKAVKAGCSGVVMKNTASKIIVEIVRSVYTRKVLGLFTTAGDRTKPVATRIATKREREVIALLAQGYKDHEIANKLVIRPQTVRNHLQSIYAKYGVSSRLELMVYAVSEGLHLSDS